MLHHGAFMPWNTALDGFIASDLFGHTVTMGQRYYLKEPFTHLTLSHIIWLHFMWTELNWAGSRIHHNWYRPVQFRWPVDCFWSIFCTIAPTSVPNFQSTFKSTCSPFSFYVAAATGKRKAAACFFSDAKAVGGLMRPAYVSSLLTEGRYTC